MRDDGIVKISRNIKDLNRKIREVEKKYGSELTTSQLASILSTTEENINLALKSRNHVDSVNDNSIYENMIDNREYENNIIEKIMILELVNNLSIKDKTIIILRYYKFKTQTQIANLLGISQVQVSRIERRALYRLKTELVRGEESY